MKRFFLAYLLALNIIFIQGAHASESTNNQLTVSIPNSLIAKKGCTDLKIQYKIRPDFRDLPGGVTFRLLKEPNPGLLTFFAQETLLYNIDESTGAWLPNNVDYSDTYILEFCDEVREGDLGKEIDAVTESGTYYLIVQSVFGRTLNPWNPGQSDYLSMSLKISTREKILCVKGKNEKVIKGVNPKCPPGYKKKG